MSRGTHTRRPDLPARRMRELAVAARARGDEIREQSGERRLPARLREQLGLPRRAGDVADVAPWVTRAVTSGVDTPGVPKEQVEAVRKAAKR
ncbi:MAG TPA: hypothetical protein VHX66_00250 [Solirubrobacteraceae bacterium]|nr:hypothetical protein [Solirubrobacteraceae bacterium]